MARFAAFTLFLLLAFNSTGADVVIGRRPASDDVLGDPLPKGAIGRFGTVRLRHGSWVQCMRYSADEKFLFSGGKDTCIRVWDAGNGKLKTVLEGHSNDVFDLAEVPSESLLISASADHSIRVWNLKTGKMHTVIDTAKIIYSSLLYRSGRTFFASGREGTEKGVVSFLNLDSGRVLRTYTGSGGPVLSLDLSPDQSTLVCGDESGQILFWKTETGQSIRSIKTGIPRVSHLKFSNDGARVFAVCDDGTVCIFDASTGDKIISQRPGNESRVPSIAFAPDQALLYLSQLNNTLTIVDTKSLSPGRAPFKSRGSVSTLLIPSHGNLLLAGGYDGAIRFWNLQTGAEVEATPSHKGRVRTLDFSADGSLVISGGDDGTARLWDVKTMRMQSLLHTAARELTTVRFTPDGKYVALGSDDFRVMELSSGKAVFTNRQNDQVSDVAFPAQQGTAFVVFDNGKNLVAPFPNIMSNGQLNAPLTLKGRYGSMSADGAIFSTSDQSSITVIKTKDGQEHQSLSTGNDTISSHKISADGTRIAAGTYKGWIWIFDARSGKVVKQWSAHKGFVTSIQFSADGKFVASGGEDSTVKVWNASNGSEMKSFTGHLGSVTAVRFSPDTRVLASGAFDSTVLLWDLSSLTK